MHMRRILIGLLILTSVMYLGWSTYYVIQHPRSNLPEQPTDPKDYPANSRVNNPALYGATSGGGTNYTAELASCKRELANSEKALNYCKREDSNMRVPYNFVPVGPDVFDEPLTVLASSSFTYKNVPGSVLFACAFGDVLFSAWKTPVCMGVGGYILEWGGEYSLIERFNFSSVEETQTLAGVSFTEGGFGIATSSVRDRATLIVMTDTLRCLTADGMCIGDHDLTHVITLPEMTSAKVSESVFLIHLNGLLWNPSGTKAVSVVPCAEGCPDEILIGFDLETGNSRTLLEAADFEIWNDTFDVRFNPEEHVEWIDDSNLLIDGVITKF